MASLKVGLDDCLIVLYVLHLECFLANQEDKYKDKINKSYHTLIHFIYLEIDFISFENLILILP